MGNLGSPFKAVIVLNILHLEDNDEDALLVDRALRRAGYAVSLRRARNKPEFVAQLEAMPDLILSDFHLPDFDALGALDQLKDRGLDVPFILVSGAANDEDVMEAMKRGATDFLFKDRLSRLGAAISAALEYRALRHQARETQQALERSREELDYAFGNAAIGMALTTLDGRWLKVNRALCRTVGYTESELLATDCHSVTAPEDVAEDIELTRRLADGEVSSTQREKRYLHKLGHMVWVQVTASLVHGRDGAPRYRMLQVLDVTHRKAVEERFHATFEQAAVGIAHTTMEGCFLAVNHKLCEMLGYTRDELMALTTLALSHPAMRGEHAQLYQEVMDGRRPRFSAEKQWVRKDGTVIWINRTVSRADGAMGQPPYLIQVIEDITERKRAEQALQESQQSYETLVASLDGIVWEADAQSYRFLFVSRQAERLLGYPVERWIDEPTFWQDHMHPDDRDWALAYCVTATTELRSHDFEYRMIAADGRVVWLRDIVNLVVENGRPVLSRGIMVDITAAKQAQALSERLLRARRVLAECSRALVHTREQRGLLNEMCRIVVESGGYVQSHIGLAENDERQTVRPVASAGYEAGYLEGKALSWAGGGRHQGLTGKVIATGERYISRDIAADPNSRHLLERASRRGFRSMIGLPLRIEGLCIGAISIYAREKDAFDDEEVALLTTLADDIAFGIASLRKDAASRMAESQLQRLTRARKLMAGCNRVVMHADNEAGLMQEICRLAIEAGGYRQAWIGLKTEDTVAGVLAVAHAGYGDDNAPMIGASNWGDDGRYRGLASEAIASGEACIARDILNDTAQERKRGRARELEYQSSIALPLKAAGRVLGALTLHAEEKDAFDGEEINLLIELAADLSFGLSGIRTREAHRDAERRLRESEQRFRETFEQAAVGITRVDLDGALVDVNQKFCDMLGYAKDELLGKHIRDITHRDDYGRGSQYRAELAHRVMKSAAGEKRFVRKDGAVIWARRTMSTACDEAGRPQYVISVVEDITESKRAEAERARLAAIVEGSNDAIISRSLDGTIQSWNSGAERLFGHSAKEAIGQSIAIIFPAGQSAQIGANSARIESGVTIAPEEVIRRAKDGRLIEVMHKMSPVRDAGGRVVGVSVTLWDDTARKRAERALQRKTEMAQLLESLARAANEAATPENAMRTCLERICEHGGWALGRLGIYGPDEGERFPENSLWQSNDPARYEPLMRASVDAKYFAVHGQFITAVRKQKRPVWLADIASSPGFGRMRVALDCGLRSAFAFPVIVGNDVTAFLEFFGTEAREPDTMLLEAIGSVGAQLARLIERSRALKATLELAAIVEGSNDAIIGRSLDGTIISWNAGAERMLGYAAAEAIGQPITLFLPLGQPDRTREINEKALRGEAIAPHDTRRRTKDGRVIVVRSSISPLRDSVGRIIGASQILQDVTALRQAEEAQARLAAIVESSNDAIISRGLDRTILTWNPAAERLFGWTAQEAIGQSIHLIVPPERIGENAPYRDKIRERLPVPEYDTVRLAKGGRRVHVSLSQSPIRNDRGEVIAVSLILRDITERKDAERAVASERTLLRTIIDALPDRIYVKDCDGRHLLENATSKKQRIPYSEDVIGKTVFDLYPREVAERLHAEDSRIVETGRPLVNRERSAVDASGAMRWLVTSKMPFRDAAGRVAGIVGVNRDITERKLETRRREMEYAVTRLLAESASVDEAMPSVIRIICEATSWTYGARWAWNPAEQCLCRAEYWSTFELDFDPRDRERWMRMTAGGRGGLLRRAWQAGAPTWIANVGEDKGFRRWPSCAKFGLRGAYAFPILAGISTIGLMEFFGPAERKIDEALLQATESIGRQIGQFIQRKEAEEAQRRSEAMLGATFEQAAVGMAIRAIDPREPRWIQVNQKLCDILGYTREELLQLTPLDISPPEERATTIDSIEQMYRGKIRSCSREKRYVRKDGRVIWTNISLSTVNGPDGQPAHVVSVVQDINDRKRAEAALHESEEQFRQLANNIPQVFWITDVQHRQTLYVSPAAERLIGRPLQDLQATPRALVRAVHREDRARVRAARKDAATGGYDETYRVVRPDGSIRWVHDRAFPVLDESGAVYRVAGIAEDVTERKQAEERFLQLAHYDVLTSLPNRVLFYDRLKQVLAQARRNQWVAGVMFIDVDRFKNVNDTLGHAVGDQLLQQVSERLTHAVRTGDTVGRLGGDEFAVVLSNLASAQDASLVAQKVMASFSEPFKLDGAELYVTASIGISLYPDDSADQDVLIRNADAAMYRAKEVGRNSYQFYTPEMNQRALEILNMESSLRRALDRKEYLLYFQPKARIADGETVGMEALLRWQHPERGLISPAVFMPVLEETGLIVPVGEWVLNAVCAQIRAWERTGIRPVPVAVNLSARQFGTHDLGPTIRRILEAHQVDPSLIELEITESSLMANTEEAARTLEFLEKLGVGLSIDDFGTGYSSLGYLKRFPLDALKIDRSFVRDITTDPDDATITRAVISMAHSLGLKVIAEGVEAEAQLAFLAEYGCDEIQGYFLARPLPAGECGAWLADGRTLHRAPQVPQNAPVVLLVDDDDDTLILLKRSLTKDGYRILAARNAHEALDVLGREHVDVVISDQNMPGVPGVEFLQRVKQLSPRTVRMMTSGHTDFQMVADAVNKGEIFRFLPKSLREEQLRGDVREALQARTRSGPDGHYPAPGTMGK